MLENKKKTDRKDGFFFIWVEDTASENDLYLFLFIYFIFFFPSKRLFMYQAL